MIKTLELFDDVKVKFRGKIYSSIKSAAKENGVHERVVKRESEVMPNE